MVVVLAAACSGSDEPGADGDPVTASAEVADASSGPVAPAAGAVPVDAGVLLDAVAAASAVSGVLSPPRYAEACALRPSGSLACWGLLDGDPLAGSFTAVGLGEFSCGLRPGGLVQCWDYDRDERGRWSSFAPWRGYVPPGPFSALSVGGRVSCGLRADGAAECWGIGDAPTLKPVMEDVAHPGGVFSAVSAGHAHACGLRPDRTVACWGKNWFGQADAPTEGRFLAVDAGISHSCGLRTDAEIVCWGEDSLRTAQEGSVGFKFGGDRDAYRGSEFIWGSSESILGSALLELREELARRSEGWEPPPGPYVAVTAGAGFTCGLRLAGDVACWGYFDSGDMHVPLEVLSDVAGNSVIAELIAHYQAEYEELRDDPNENAALVFWVQLLKYLHAYATLTDVPPGRFVTVAAGYTRACGIRPEGTVECWGSDASGFQAPPPIGRLATAPIDAGNPTAAPPSPFVALTTGPPVCALRADATITCWTDGFDDDQPPDGRFSPDGHFSDIAVAGVAGFVCGLRTEATVTCWGDDPPGELHIDALDEHYTALDNGPNDVCGLRTDATITCWGREDNALVEVSDSDMPDGHYSTLAVGAFHACGLRTDTTIACWGDNKRGQTDAPAGRFSTLAGGAFHACGVRTDATVACWGDNEHGQTDAPAGQFSSVAIGRSHSCGVRTDATVTCWGEVDDDRWRTLAAPDGQFTAITVGGLGACGLRPDATVTCWADGSEVIAAPDGRFTAIGPTRFGRFCGLHITGHIICWGYLGGTTVGYSRTPTEP